MLNAPQGESPFRRLSAEDEEMFFKSSSLPVDPSLLKEQKEDQLPQRSAPLIPDLTEEKLKDINMPKRISL